MNQLREQIENLKLQEQMQSRNNLDDSKKDLEESISLWQLIQNYLKSIRKNTYTYYKNTIKTMMGFLSSITFPIKAHKDKSDEGNTKLTPVQNSILCESPAHLFSRIKLPTIQEIKQIRQIQQQKKNLILWDIENISYRHIDTVLHHADAVGDLMIISVSPLGKKQTYNLFPYVLLYGITIHTDHEDSDEKLIELLNKYYRSYNMITIVSSDTDFVHPIKRVLRKKKRVQVIVRDSQKRGMLMRLKLDNEYLTIKTIQRRVA